MYFSETFPQVCHVEESTRLEKLEEQRRAQEAAKAAAAPHTQQHGPQQHIDAQAARPVLARSLTQAFLQRPPLSRPGSSGVLGHIFQGFSREVTSHSQQSSAASTPTHEKRPHWTQDPDPDPNLIRGFY